MTHFYQCAVNSRQSFVGSGEFVIDGLDALNILIID
jgi:hypothetical protein